MPLVPAKCPECGGNVVVDSEKDAWICDFCKTPFIVEKAINNFNTINNITNKVTNDIKADVVNVYENQEKDFIIRAGELIKYNGESMDVVIPENIVSIAKDTFVNSNIHTIVIHDGVRKVGDFNGCTILEKIKLPRYLEGELPCFSGCVSLKHIDIPSHINKIGIDAFRNCKSLERIVIPEEVKEIGESAFYGCLSLTDIDLPDTLECFSGDGYHGGIFEKCESLRQIKIPSRIFMLNGRIFVNGK